MKHPLRTFAWLLLLSAFLLTAAAADIERPDAQPVSLTLPATTIATSWQEQLTRYWDRAHAHLAHIHKLCHEAKVEHAVLGHRAKRLTLDDVHFDLGRLLRGSNNEDVKLTMTHNERDKAMAEVDPELRGRVMAWARQAADMGPAAADSALARLAWMSPWRRVFEEMAIEAEWRRQASLDDPVVAYQQVFHQMDLDAQKTPVVTGPSWYESVVRWGQRHLRKAAGCTCEDRTIE